MAICNPENVLGLLGPMVGTAFATMLLLLALFYMAAQFFRRQEYEAFVSVELYQLAISAVLFSTIFASSCFADEIASSMSASLFGPGNDSFSVAGNYLNYIANEIALPAIMKLQGLLMLSQWAGSIIMRFGAGVWGVAMPAFPSFITIERTVEFLLMLISPFTASLTVQQIGLQVIRGTMLPFVLPIGAVFRIFPPTRDAGSFIIATALAFQVVFPFTYVMHAQIVQGILIPAAYGSNEDVAQIMSNQGLSKVSVSVSEYGLFDVSGMLFTPLKSISFLLLQAIFLPALSMVITVAFIKGFNKFISQKLG